MKRKICITHAWHNRIDKNHIIWLNPIMFYEYLRYQKYENKRTFKAIDKNIEIYLSDIYNIDFDEFTDLFIFITGSIKDEIIDKLDKSKANIYFIIEDPDYEISIPSQLLNRSIVLTPYQILNDKDLDSQHKLLTEICDNYHFDKPKSFKFLPTGILPLHSKWYQKSIKQNYKLKYKNDRVRQNTKTLSAYCGSLKEDRFYYFTQQDFDEGIDFYTNRLTKSKLQEMTGLDSSNVICHQKISPLEVTHALRQVDNIYFLAEPKMQILDSIYLRYFELAEANKEIRFRGDKFSVIREQLKFLEFGMKDNKLDLYELRKAWSKYKYEFDSTILELLNTEE